MPKWSKIDKLETKVEELYNSALLDGIFIEQKKEIPYGVQLHCEGPEESGTVTLYYSKKKGFSAVNNSKNSVTDKVSALFLGEPSSNYNNKNFIPTIGSDEAGKGDFFGPLCTAAFYLETEEMANEIIKLGIRDSKKLTDSKIKELAKVIHAKWPKHLEIISPSVEKYNELYAGIGNLNKLLGWMHGRVIANLSERFYTGKKINCVVDKFADKSNVTSSVGGLERVKLSAVTKGEDKELSIAVASVIARDRFVYLMEKMSKELGEKIPFGANSKVKIVARNIVNKQGYDELKKYVKMHFKTAKEL